MSAQLEQLMNAPRDVLAKIPAAKPPPGVTPNFANPETQVPLIMGMNTTFFAIATIFLGVRIYMKAWIKRKWGLDDSKSDMMPGSSYYLHVYSISGSCLSHLCSILLIRSDMYEFFLILSSVNV